VELWGIRANHANCTIPGQNGVVSSPRTAFGEARRSFNPARMHLANTYASDLLAWQKDAKLFLNDGG
jgi:hypothetical protein